MVKDAGTRNTAGLLLDSETIAPRRKNWGPGENVADEDTIVSGMAGRYALALFSLAQDAHTTGEVATDLKSFDGLIAESADLLYHLLVLLKSRGVKLADVEAALGQRTQMSGLEEKASRKKE